MVEIVVGRMLTHRYRIEALIGRGGMAEVYRAFDTRRGYAVALKVLREDLAEDWEFVRRFRAEAESLSRLAHQNIVRFYSFEQDGPLAFIVMDYVEGDTLRRRLFEWQGLPMPPMEALVILRQVTAALQFAHGEGIIHRDVKPGNIMLKPDGTALLSDFGIAKAADAATVTAMAPGTPAYMSPEQCRGDRLDARSDVYSLGVVLYEMLAGRRPLVGEGAPETVTGGTLERVRWEQLHAEPPDPRIYNPALTEGMARAVLWALAKDPGRRHASTAALCQAFEEACGARLLTHAHATPETAARGVSVPPAGQDADSPLLTLPGAQRPVTPATLRPIFAAVGVGALAVVLVAAAFMAGQNLRNAGLGRSYTTAELSHVPAVLPSPAATASPAFQALIPMASATGPLPSTATPAALAVSTTGMATLQPPATVTVAATLPPTASPTPAPTPPISPTPVPAVRPNGAAVNLRGGPGTNYPIVGQATGDRTYPVAARSDDGSWFRLAGQEERWIAAGIVDITGVAPAALPVAAAPAEPLPASATPTPAATTTNATASAQPAQPGPQIAATGQIAYQLQPRGVRGGQSGTFRLDLATGVRTALSVPDQCTGLDISVDGTLLACAIGGGGWQYPRPEEGVYLISLTGGGEQITRSRGDEYPTIAHKGRRVAYINHGAIYVWEKENARNVAAGSWRLSWSPDDDWLAFEGTRGGIFKVPTGGGAPILVTDAGDLPAWGMNHRIAFSRGNDIWVMNEDGSGAVRLTDHRANDYAPAWSPDGANIVFVSERDGNAELYIMKADGSGQTRLTNTPEWEIWPSWSR